MNVSIEQMLVNPVDWLHFCSQGARILICVSVSACEPVFTHMAMHICESICDYL
jgi:hypothetical protein